MRDGSDGVVLFLMRLTSRCLLSSSNYLSDMYLCLPAWYIHVPYIQHHNVYLHTFISVPIYM